MIRNLMLSLSLLIASFATSGFAADPIVPDPDLEGEWWIDALNIQDSWEYSTGKGITIALCDSGYYIDEPDLASNLDMNRAIDFADLDNPGSVDDGPYAFHGTSSAALIAGVRDGRGTQGIAFDANILPLQNYNYDDRIDDLSRSAATRDCVRYAAGQPDTKIIVIQMSSPFGTVESYQTIRETIRDAIRGGTIVIIPAGELGLELAEEAEDDTGSIIVGALSREGQTAYYSNYGERVTVSAFGEQVRTLVGRGGQMGYFGGTTSATAQVAGTVALMLSVNPNLKPFEVRQVLENTRVTTEANTLVGGQLDARAAVILAASGK